MDDPNYTPIGPDPVYAPLSLNEMEPGFGEYFEAAAGNVIRDSPTSSLFRSLELSAANSAGGARTGFRGRTIDAETAKAEAQSAGVDVDFGTGTYTRQALDIMIDRAKRRQVRDSVIAQYDPSMGTQLGVSLLTSLADPLNVGSAFIPFVGEARYTQLLAGASSFAMRTGIRAGLGAVEGAAGAAIVEPFIAESALSEGRDYQLADSLRNIAFGGLFGGGLHVAGGTVAEKVFKRQYASEPIQSPPDVVQRLPEEINEAALRAAVSDMISGRKAASAEVIDLFMKNDPSAASPLSYMFNLQRSGPAIDDTLGRIEWWNERLSGKPWKPEGEDFLTWVRNQGGLKDAEGVLEAELGAKPDLPASAYITAKGSKNAKRGISFDDMLQAAIDQGFVQSRQEFIDAFKASQRSSPLRKQFRQTDEARMREEENFARHKELMITEAGVNKNASNISKARAIVAREQHLLATERARINSAVERLLQRQKEYRDANDPSKVTPPKPYEMEVAKTTTTAEEPIAVGDMVNVAMGDEKIQMNAKPVKVTRVMNDPVYGTYVLVEGSNTGIAAKDLVRVGEPAARKAPDAPKVEASAAEAAPEVREALPPGSRQYPVKQVQKAIETALKVDENAPVPTSRIFADYLPGISKKQFDKAVNEIRQKRPNLTKTNKNGEEVIFFGKMSKEMQETETRKMLERKIDAVRRMFNERFPGLADSQTYYLNEMFGAQTRASFGLGEDLLVKHLNRMAADGRIEFFADPKGKTNTTKTFKRIGVDHLYSDDRGYDVMIRFKDKLKDPEPAPKAEKAAKEPAAPVAENVPPPVERAVDNPPAPREALTSEELNKATAQYTQLRAQTERRLNAMMDQLPPETAATIKAELARIETDAAELENLYNSAVSCLLKPV